MRETGERHLRAVPSFGGDEPGLMGPELVREALALALAFIMQHVAANDPDLSMVAQVADQLRSLTGS